MIRKEYGTGKVRGHKPGDGKKTRIRIYLDSLKDENRILKITNNRLSTANDGEMCHLVSATILYCAVNTNFDVKKFLILLYLYFHRHIASHIILKRRFPGIIRPTMPATPLLKSLEADGYISRVPQGKYKAWMITRMGRSHIDEMIKQLRSFQL